MSIAARVKRFLDQHRVSYQILNYERTHSQKEAIQKLKIPAHKVLKAVPITDGLTTVMAVLAANSEIDFVSIESELKGRFQIIPAHQNQVLFCDCEFGCVPPIGEAYELGVILDKHLENLDKVYIETGSHSALLEMSIDDFRFINGGAPLFSFSYPKAAQNAERNSEMNAENQNAEHQNAENQHEKWKVITDTFPSLPLLAQKIFHLAESLMTKHRTPILKNAARYFKFAEFDQVALALATHQVFKLPKDVFLGSKTFWKQALYAASLSEGLARKINVTLDLDPELCYLLGFTHNFGFLLFGHLFFHEYRLLSKWIQQNPEEPIERLERKLLGMGKGGHMVGRGHAEMGAWLMKYWNMPEIFVRVSEHHHASQYNGAYATHIALMQLTNQLLYSAGIGKETFSVPIEKNLISLGITMKTAEGVLQELIADPMDLRLEEMALHLAS